MSDKLRTLLVDLGMDNALAALDAEREAHAKDIEAYRELIKRNDEAYLIMKETQDKEIADLRKTLTTIASYDKDGFCPYGCDCPNIAQVVLKGGV